jgi:DNA-directed RNA polymerase subunit N (RpoN/RPB10)
VNIIGDIIAAIRKVYAEFFGLPQPETWPTTKNAILSREQVAMALDDLADGPSRFCCIRSPG